MGNTPQVGPLEYPYEDYEEPTEAELRDMAEIMSRGPGIPVEGDIDAYVTQDPTPERMENFIRDPQSFTRNNPRIAGAIQEGTQGAAVGAVTGGPAGAISGALFGAAGGAAFPPQTGGERGASLGMDAGAALAGNKGRIAQWLARTLGAGLGAAVGSGGDAEEGFATAAGTGVVGGVFGGLGKAGEKLLGLDASRKGINELTKLADQGKDATKKAALRLGLVEALPQQHWVSKTTKGFQQIFGGAARKETEAEAFNLGLNSLGVRALAKNGVAKFSPDAQAALEAAGPKFKVRQNPRFDLYKDRLEKEGIKPANNLISERGFLNQATQKYVDGGLKGGLTSDEGQELLKRFSAARHIIDPDSWQNFREAVLAKEILGSSLETVAGENLLSGQASRVINPKKVAENIEKYRSTDTGARALDYLLDRDLPKAARDEFWNDITAAFSAMNRAGNVKEGSGAHYVGQKLFFQLVAAGSVIGGGAGAFALGGSDSIVDAGKGVTAVVGFGALLNTLLDSPRGAKILVRMVNGDTAAPRTLMKLLVNNERLQGTRKDLGDTAYINIEDTQSEASAQELQGTIDGNRRTAAGAF